MKIKNNEEFLHRLKELSAALGKTILIIENPTTQDIQVFSGNFANSLNIKKPNPNTNNYLEVEGAEVTDLLSEKWNVIAQANGINQDSLIIHMNNYHFFEYTFSPSCNWFTVRAKI